MLIFSPLLVYSTVILPACYELPQYQILGLQQGANIFSGFIFLKIWSENNDCQLKITEIILELKWYK